MPQPLVAAISAGAVPAGAVPHPAGAPVAAAAVARLDCRSCLLRCWMKMTLAMDSPCLCTDDAIQTMESLEVPTSRLVERTVSDFDLID